MNVAIAIICIQSLILTWVSRGIDWTDSLFQSAIGCPKWSRGYFGTWMLDFHIQQLLLCLNTANTISYLQLVLCIVWGVLSNHLNYKEPFIGIDSVHIYIKSTTIKNIKIKSPLQWITVQDCTMPSSGKTVNDWSSVRSQNITEAAEILKILIRMDQKEVCSFFNIRTGMKQNGPVGTQVSLIKNIRVKVFVAYRWEKCYKWTLTIWWRQVRTHL